MNNLFFELLQVTLGTRAELSRVPNAHEWEELCDEAERQAVAGVVFPAIEQLCRCGQKPPSDVLYEWIGLAEQIKQQNKIVNRNSMELCRALEKDGFKCCVLKGQGNTLAYPSALSRTPGDIDVWVKPTLRIKAIVRYVKKRNPEAHAMYHHIDLGAYNGTEVEVHYRPSFMFNPLHNHRLQRWFCQAADAGCSMADLPDGAGRINIPTRDFNIIFQLSHIYNHLLHEGIGLRQLVDYFYLLRNMPGDTGKVNQGDCPSDPRMRCIMGTVPTDSLLRELGLEKIAGAVMWVLNERLGLKEEYLIAPKDEKRGKVLLAEIMRGGNFGFYDIANQRADSRFKKAIQRFKRDLRLMRYFPSECLWEPVFRVYHFFWRVRYNDIGFVSSERIE